MIAADIPGSRAWKRAEANGVKAMSVADAARAADYIQILLPDEHQGRIYREQIAPIWRRGMFWDSVMASTSATSRSSRPRMSMWSW